MSQVMNQYGNQVTQLTGTFPVGAQMLFGQGMANLLNTGIAISNDGKTVNVPLTMQPGMPGEQVVVLMSPDGSYSTTMGFHLAK
jgi:hypothetical protein